RDWSSDVCSSDLQPTSNIQHPMDAGRGAFRTIGCWLLDVGCWMLILIVRLYRCTLSPAKTFVFGPRAECRFTPSCSAYAIGALKTHGPLGGSWLAVKRICRCHPWGGCGHDPVPPKV